MAKSKEPNPGPVKARADRHSPAWKAHLGGVVYDPRVYEIVVSNDERLCALKMSGDPMYPAPSITVPMTADDALRIGALLIAHSDWLKGRKPRDWSQLAA
jgi:hypothetical protein